MEGIGISNIYNNGIFNSEDLIALWLEAFGDDSDFTKLLFNTGFIVPENIFSLSKERSNKLICALNAPSYLFNINQDKKNEEISYICSAATFKEYRNQGCMSYLLNLVLQSLSDRNQLLAILIPSEKSLFNYYNRFGFAAAFYIGKYVFNKDVFNSNFTDNITYEIERIETDSQKLPFLYDNYKKRFSNCNFTCYKPFERFKQSVSEHSYDKDKSGFYSVGEGSAFIYFGDDIHAREVSGIENEVLAKSLIKKYNKSVVIEDLPEKNNKEELGMARILNIAGFLDKIKKDNNLEFAYNIKDDILPENNINIACKNGIIYKPKKAEETDIFEFSNFIFKYLGFGYMNNMLN